MEVPRCVEMQEESGQRREEIRDTMDIEGEECTERVPPWTEQLTLRSLVVAFLIGVMYSVIVMKLNLTTGLVPTLNVSASLVAYVVVRAWTAILDKAGIFSTPFTRQENTVIQTCGVGCYNIAISAGFGSYLLAMNKKTYELAGVDTFGNAPGSYKKLELGWMIAYTFVVCFVGLFILVPLRKILIIDYKLTYPSGVATAVLINGFHDTAKKGASKMAKRQIRMFTQYFGGSFLWSFFQWFFSGGPGEVCGFNQFPTFGLKAWQQTFFFDFYLTYVGAGMICSHLVNLSLLLGAVLSWGIMWPLINTRKGDWYPADIKESSMKSLYGYKAFLTIALILGDGLYSFVKITFFTLQSMGKKIVSSRMNSGSRSTSRKWSNWRSSKNVAPVDAEGEAAAAAEADHETLKLNEVFTADTIPTWIAPVGYVVFSVVSIVAIPFIFPELKWYYVVVSYLIAPVLGFCNAYGAGLTDMNMAYNYGKVGLFVLAAMGGPNSGVIAGLAACGLIKSVVFICADLMHDFKTGHLTLTSPRSMFVSQSVGTAMGCVVSPLVFYLFYKAFDVGNPEGNFKAPYALIYRNMAILGVEGFSALPNNCLELCYGFFAFAVAANIVRDLNPRNLGKYVPLPMVMALPFLVGASFAIDMCLGSLIVFVWNRLDAKKAPFLVPAVASGFICGDGIWTLPAAVLAIAGVSPPICMKFTSA